MPVVPNKAAPKTAPRRKRLPTNSFLGQAGLPVGLNATASTPGSGVTVEELVRRSNYWRDNYNPLRGLTVARLSHSWKRRSVARLRRFNWCCARRKNGFPC